MLGQRLDVLQFNRFFAQFQRQRSSEGYRRRSRDSSSSSSSRGSSSSARASSITTACASPSSVSDLDAYARNCHVLEAGAVLCNAEIAALPGGARGMVAKQLILPGQSVLECAAANILAVPKTVAAIGAWQSWLQLYTSAHGPLPQQLQDFLADTTHSPTVRLASWLLHLRACCCAGSSADTSSPSSCYNSACTRPSAFWCSYILLLQACGPMTAVCSGAWSQGELQQLEPPALREWACRHHADARKAALAAYTLLAAGQHPVAQLDLASSSADVGWAMALVKTRAHGDGSRLALMPLHDMINHRDRGSANCAPGTPSASRTETGYTLFAVATIQPGEEVTNTYTAPLSNEQMLLGWGFTQPAKAGDWLLAVPLQYGVLPLMPWQAAVQAAAALVARHQKQQQQPGSVHKQEAAAALLAQLACLAANLPLMLPESIWDGGRGCQAAAAAFEQQLFAPTAEQQQQQQEVYRPLHGSMLQREKVETLFARDLNLYLQQQQPQVPAEPSWSALDVRQQQLQRQQAWSAAALQGSCLIQLAACRTTIEQDAGLLRQLQQQEQQQQCSASNSPLLILQPQQQLDTAAQKLLQQLEALQQQLVHTLALLDAYSSLRSMCDATAESAQVVLSALQPRVQQLEQQLALPPWQGQGCGLKQAAAAVAEHCQGHVLQLLMQQDALLQQLTRLRRHHYQQQQLSNKASGDQPGQQPDGAIVAGEAVQPVAGLPAGMRRQRLAAAVAARLEQKQLLTIGAELCGQIQQLLANTGAG